MQRDLLENTPTIVGVLRIKGHIHGSKKGKYRYSFQPYHHKLPSLLVFTNINRTSTPGEIFSNRKIYGMERE